MCGIVDDILPVAGAVLGSFIPGLGTAVGAAIGGAIGGATKGWVQTHNLGNTLGGALEGGAMGYAGGGAIGNIIGGAGAGTTAAFDTGLGSATGITQGAGEAAGSLGGLESGMGGAAMFGPAAGTGTAIGSSTAGALGGGGLGIAGGGALSGISDSPAYLGALGGGYQGTGLGLGGTGSAQAGLGGVMGSTSPIATSGTSAAGIGQPNAPTSSPVESLNQMTPGAGVTSPTGSPVGGATGLEGGSISPEGVQAAAANPEMASGSGAPYGYGAATSGYSEPSTGGGVSAMFGPDSTATTSPMGSAISGAGTSSTPGVQFGTLGQGVKSGMDLSDLASLYKQYSPLMSLARSGVGAYQNWRQQQAYNDYRNQIDQEFSPNSPYAQQMAQTLARQDAAAGRNSQYGTRSVQLAAALAQAHANALGNSNYFRAATATPGANMLNSLFYNFPNTVQGVGQLAQLGSAGFNGLQNLFGG